MISHLEKNREIEVFNLKQAFLNDPFENKVNLTAEAFPLEKGEPCFLCTVKHAEKIFAYDDTLLKEYATPLGVESFCDTAIKLLLGNQSLPLLQNRVCGIQTIAGTGSLRLAAEFLSKELGCKVLYVSNPTWTTYQLVFRNAGFKDLRHYKYWKKKTRSLNLNRILTDLNGAPENSVIILQCCGHNPTGCDPTHDQWKDIAEVIRKKKIFPVIDCSYQGMASGDLEEDAWVPRYFASSGFEFFCCQSFSKNFGLYNERVGNLVCVAQNAEVIKKIKSRMMLLCRGMYASPPVHGARIVAYIINNPLTNSKWKRYLQEVVNKVIGLRRQLRETLEKLGTPGNWEHITNQIGMSCLIGLTEEQSQYMVNKHHVYMLSLGSISVCGLTAKNIDYVAAAIHDSITNMPGKIRNTEMLVL